MAKELKLLAFTHHDAELDLVGKLHISPDALPKFLPHLKRALKIDELLYLSTCNRVELIFVCEAEINSNFISNVIQLINPRLDYNDQQLLNQNARCFSGNSAIQHCFEVAASLDSLVVGEREIITQFRKAYELCHQIGTTGDFIRLLVKATIEAAKRIYTETGVSRNPVSVVSLAYRKLRELNVRKDARFLVVGAGQTNVNLCKFLKKHGFERFTVFNRSEANGISLANMLNAEFNSLDKLAAFEGGFDVLICCTSASDYIVDSNLYSGLLRGETNRKIVIDLAVPADVNPAVYKQFQVMPILVESLREIADENLEMRRNELDHCHRILQEHVEAFGHTYRHRQVELAMQEIPKMVREIRSNATERVFARELNQLDDQSRGILEEVINYMEKKYISGPMKIAKEILLEKA
jgi:glutamyl-tRNA reductase